MGLSVWKFGGTSVGSVERIKLIARRIARERKAGRELVIVVSAMGDTTDDLLELARQVTTNPKPRELDFLLSTGELVSSALLAMALNDIGCRAISLSGYQAGILTDPIYSRARILKIDTKRLREELDRGNVVVVAGFQGMNEGMDVTTLGRGGSDTTAVALAAVLNAEECRIYTDVDGVYTADPSVVPEARKLDRIDYEEMLELASYGAKVLHPRAVEIGWWFKIPIVVTSSFNDNAGTLIDGGESMEVRRKATAVAHDLNVAKITIVGVPDRPGIAASIFEPLADAGISVDCIVQNASIDGITDLTFTVSRENVGEVMKIIQPIAKEVGAAKCVSDTQVGKVSLIGAGMLNTPGYAAKMFKALAREGINIELISTSEIRITCILREDKVPDAVKVLHREFELASA